MQVIGHLGFVGRFRIKGVIGSPRNPFVVTVGETDGVCVGPFSHICSSASYVLIVLTESACLAAYIAATYSMLIFIS